MVNDLISISQRVCCKINKNAIFVQIRLNCTKKSVLVIIDNKECDENIVLPVRHESKRLKTTESYHSSFFLNRSIQKDAFGG